MKVFLGVEIGEAYLKVVKAKRKGGQAKLIDCGVKQITSSKEADIAQDISNIIKTDKSKPKSVIVSLPRNLVTVRNLHLPSQDEQEISKMIELHIDRIVPYKKEDVVFSYCFSGRDEIGYTRVILAIAHSEIVRKQIKILDQVGFLVDKINLSSYGIWQGVFNNYRSQINQKDFYLILDSDTTFTDFIIFNWGGLLFTRSINIRAGEIETEIGRRKFLGELRQSLLVFQNEEVNKKPVKIFLSGISNKELSDLIQAELNVEVENVAGVISKEILKLENRTLPADISYSSVANLIFEHKVQKLSFILPEIQIRKAFREKIRDLVVLGSLSIYFVSFICVIFLSQIYNQERYLKELNAQYSQIGNEVDTLVHHLDRIEDIKDYLNLRRLSLYIVHHLQKAVTGNIFFSYINIDENNTVVVRGQAQQLAEVFKLTGDLEKTDYFADAQTKYTRQRRVKEETVTDFEINFRVVPEDNLAESKAAGVELPQEPVKKDKQPGKKD